MTPLTVMIALHYVCRMDDYGRCNGDNNFEAPAVQQAIIDFRNAGLLSDRGEGCIPRYEATDGLRIYVNAICAVPWPTHKWVMA